MNLWSNYGFKVTFTFEPKKKSYDNNLKLIPIDKLEEFKSNITNFFNNENIKCKNCKSKKIKGKINIKIEIHEIFKEVEQKGIFRTKLIDQKINEQFIYQRYGFDNDYSFKCKNCGIIFSDNSISNKKMDEYMIAAKNYLQHLIKLVDAPNDIYNWTIKMLIKDVNKNFMEMNKNEVFEL